MNHDSEQTGADSDRADSGRQLTLSDLLDSSGRVRVLDVFLGKGRLPLSRSDVADLAGVHRSTASRRVAEFREHGLVEPVPESSDPELFRLNASHPAAGPLREAHSRLFEHVDRLQAASDDYDPDDDLYVAGSPFVELFRSPANVELFLALLAYPGEVLTASELARAADLDPSTVGDNVDVLVDIGVADRFESGFTEHPRYSLAAGSALATEFRRAVDALGGETGVSGEAVEHDDGSDTAGDDEPTPVDAATEAAAEAETETAATAATAETAADTAESLAAEPVEGVVEPEPVGGLLSRASRTDDPKLVYETDGAELTYDPKTETVTCEINARRLPEGLRRNDLVAEFESFVERLTGRGADEQTSGSRLDH